MQAADYYLVPGHGDVVCAFGEAVLDLIAVVEQQLPIGGQIHGKFRVTPGGCALNVSTAVARLGGKARFVGRLGAGQSANEIDKALAEAGVNVRGIIKGRYTVSLGLQLASGETTFITDDSDAGLLSADAIDTDWFENAAVIHATGYDFFDKRRTKTVLRVAEIAHANNIPFVFEIAVGNELDEFGVDKFRGLIASDLRPSMLLCNEFEGDVAGVTGKYFEGAGVVVRHRAAASTQVFFSTGDVDEIPLARVGDFTDTVGAGDAFASGLFCAWAQNKSLADAISSGHDSAYEYLHSLANQKPFPSE